jgi:hypothetical protein
MANSFHPAGQRNSSPQTPNSSNFLHTLQIGRMKLTTLPESEVESWAGSEPEHSGGAGLTRGHRWVAALVLVAVIALLIAPLVLGAIVIVGTLR